MVLVTGGSGFLGNYLLKLLADRGEKVRAIKRPSSDLSALGELAHQIEWVDGDVLDVISLEEALQGVKQVYHCAAVVSFNPRHKDQMMRVNVDGTANVVNLSLDCGVQKLLHVSSTAALGRTKSGQHINEQAKWHESKLNSNYAISKFQAEQEVWRGIAEGLNAVIVNPSIILGAGDWSKGSAHITQRVWNGLRYYTKGINGFVDVRDVAAVMIQLMNSDISDERFIVNGENWSIKDLLFLMADQLQTNRPDTLATDFLSNLAWRLETFRSSLTGKEPMITRETAASSLRQYFYDNEKIKRTLGFEFTPIQQTIKATCQAFLESKERPVLLA